MANVKYSETNITSAIELVNTICSDLDSAKSAVMNFTVSADGYSSGWYTKAEEIATYTYYDDKKNLVTAVDNAVLNSGLNQISTYDNCKSSITSAASKLNSFKNRIASIATSLQVIKEAVKAFEDEHRLVNIEEIVQSLINSGEIDTTTFNTEKFSYQLNDDGNYIMYYELDGKRVTLSDMLNAFYTYSGVSMSANVEGRYLAEQLGMEFDDSYQVDIMKGVNGFMSEAVDNNYFGVADLGSINEAANSLGVELQQNASFDSILNEYGSDYDPDKIASLKDALGGDVNSVLTIGASVGASLIGAYTLTENLDFKKKEDTTVPEKNTGGDTKPSTPEVKPDKDEKPVQPNEPEVKPGIDDKPELPTEPELPIEPEVVVEPEDLIEITDEVIPDDVVAEVGDVDYDDLAREQYESQGREAIYEHRAEILEKVDNMLKNGDVTSLKEQLSDYGYSEPEIDAILENPELTKAAFIEGDQRAQLTDIANKLAEDAGVKDFDTKYDDGQEYQDLQDGTTSSEYIANMSLDENVTSTRDAFNDAKVDYENAVNEANAYIDKANDARVAMDNLKSEYGDDISKWTQEQADAYNEAVSDYNDAVELANDKVDAIQEVKDSYLNAQSKYESAKEDFLSRIKEANDLTKKVDTNDSASSMRNETNEFGGNGGANPNAIDSSVKEVASTNNNGSGTFGGNGGMNPNTSASHVISNAGGYTSQDTTSTINTSTSVDEEPLIVYDIPQWESLAQAEIKPSTNGDVITVSDEQLLNILNVDNNSASFK